MASQTTVDDIWTYDRVPGRRIVFLWCAPDLPPGVVQMDFVFGELMLAAPEVFKLGEQGNLWMASRPLSLAWKLLWLEGDIHPQGKDLYDAVLLAEQTQLPLELLQRVLASAGELGRLTPDFPLLWHVDWANFQKEYPWVRGDTIDWQRRLTQALAPTFSSSPEPPP